MRLAFLVSPLQTRAANVSQSANSFKLAMDAVAIAAGDEAEVVAFADARKDAPGACDEFRFCLA